MSGLFFPSRGLTSRPAATRAGAFVLTGSGAGHSRFACGPP